VDDLRFQQEIAREMRSKQIAREILGVNEDASSEDLKRVWRKLCMKHHPDRNPDDEEASKRFAAINCAYNLLAHGKPCEILPPQQNRESTAPEHGKYKLDNAWGLFLWWRERYF